MGGDGAQVRAWFYPNWTSPSICERHRLLNPMRQPYNGIFPDVNTSIADRDVRDGLSTTFLVGERPGDPSEDGPQLGWWAYGAGFDTFGNGDAGLDCSEGFYRGDPTDPWAHMTHFWSLHEGGGHFLMGDGSVRFVSYSINHGVFTALGSRRGHEVIGDF
jgi:prepilin-type processing-associated H-X9-DG protein